MLIPSNESVPFLNPDTYLNHLSPTDGAAVQFKNQVSQFILGAALWDVMVYFSVDVMIFRTSRFSFVLFCFIFSRLFALGVIFNMSTGRAIYIVSGCFFILSQITSSYLFLQRVIAVYHRSSKWVKWAFSIFWVIACLSDIAIAIGGHPTDIPGTHLAKDSGIAPWVATTPWCGLVYDSVIMLAITYEIWSTHKTILGDQNLPWYQLMLGRTLPALSRMIFRGGVQYYLIVVTALMVTAITLLVKSIPGAYKVSMSPILIFLMSSMASRVYRNVKLFDSGVVFSERWNVRESSHGR